MLPIHKIIVLLLAASLNVPVATPELPELALSLDIEIREPDLIGLATHYGLPGCENGDLMRNREPFDIDAATVAVNDCRRDGTGECVYDWDIPYWPRWADRWALVYVFNCNRLVRVKVTDTGRLYSAGVRRLGIRNGVKHYWEVDECECDVWGTPLKDETEWLEDETYRFVADFPVGFYEQMISCDPNVMPIVAIWIEEG